MLVMIALRKFILDSGIKAMHGSLLSVLQPQNASGKAGPRHNNPKQPFP